MPLTREINNSTGRGDRSTATSCRWKASVGIEVGDLVYQVAADGTEASAGAFTWDTNLATTQPLFKAVFRGVSNTKRLATDAVAATEAYGTIMTSGEFGFACAALGSAVLPGAYVGPAKQAGNLLEPRLVVIVATAALAIGRVTEHAAIGDTVLYFNLLATLGNSL